MLKRNITYENPFDGKPVQETHFFHISKADLIKMEMEEQGSDEYEKDGRTLTGMEAKLTRIVDSQDGKAIMREFEDIIRRAYGVKQGEKFVKSREAADEFLATEAYSQLLWELCTKAEAAAEFINGVVPSNLDQIADDVRKQAALRTKGIEAQAAAKAASGAGEPAAAPPEGATPSEDVSDPDSVLAQEQEANRTKEIAQATAENPVYLTRVEINEMDGDALSSGIAEGRFKIN